MELKEIKSKIDSVRNIWKLTGALETLSALKMKKAQKIALLSRPFAEKTAQFLEEMESNFGAEQSVFFKKSETGKVLMLVLASDRGFCGSFNSNVLKFAEKEINEIKNANEIELLPVGKKAITFFKNRGYAAKYNFFGIGDYGELEDTKSISDFLVSGFLQGKYKEVLLFYTDFISTFLQKPKKVKLLPASKENLKDFLRDAGITADSNKQHEFIVEPSRQILLETIVPQLIEYLIYQAILEGNASEHSARMMAMRNAADNAREKVTELNFAYNKARQEQITKEVCEVSSAKEVLD